jgi:hypothetical protein
LTADVDVELAVTDDVEAVSEVAGADHGLAGPHRPRHEMRCDAFLRSDRERREHRHAFDQLQLGRRRDHAVDRDEPPGGEQRQQGQDRSDDGERRSRSERFDDGRRGDRPERDGAHRYAPHDAEDTAQHPVRDDPLEERERGDVLDAVRGADDREQDERGGELGAR